MQIKDKIIWHYFHNEYRLRVYLSEKMLRRKIQKKYKVYASKIDNVSIISSDCIGGFLYHNLGKQFLSPTINMAIPAESFVRLVKNLEHYMAVEPVEELGGGMVNPSQ